MIQRLSGPLLGLSSWLTCFRFSFLQETAREFLKACLSRNKRAPRFEKQKIAVEEGWDVAM